MFIRIIWRVLEILFRFIKLEFLSMYREKVDISFFGKVLFDIFYGRIMFVYYFWFFFLCFKNFGLDDKWYNVLEFRRIVFVNFSNYDEDCVWFVLFD